MQVNDPVIHVDLPLTLVTNVAILPIIIKTLFIEHRFVVIKTNPAVRQGVTALAEIKTPPLGGAVYPKNFSYSSWFPIQNQVTVPSLNLPTARIPRVIRTDQVPSCVLMHLKRSDG
jgi:hypothetical protein